ncbi:uncharacterized protein LOC112576796 isoform X4 [Pomacea canaliculata]|uniref:uncharacterized protein LOC112576796 isoform X4 n=1 Tax=Pomacea canaliculata TaxID=400727 RepID=UPI000D73FB99|nr:uncharacterized protein LOC112576796 isoform X4 [Pomacea canaliculata]
MSDLERTYDELGYTQNFTEKDSTGCSNEIEKIRGECTQLTGLTLNKMCCWKDAVYPLMDSIAIFSKIDNSNMALVISLEMVAKCISSIPHEDFIETKSHLDFKHNDRFYQAYSMCKEAAGLAGTSGLQQAMAQNQAAEALLRFAAQHGTSTTRWAYLRKVIEEVQLSLRAHTTLSQLFQRENFFQIVRSLFLVRLALSFSDASEDQMFASCLEEWAMILYGVYCQQLCQKGFLSTSLDVADNVLVREVVQTVINEFNLKIELEQPTQNLSTEKNVIPSQIKECQTSIEKKDKCLAMPIEKKCAELRVSGSQPKDWVVDRTPRQQEVGLSIIPSDYDIPLCDVPHGIFQNLCGCKFRAEQVTDHTQLFDDHAAIQQKNVFDADGCERGKGTSGKDCITQDSGYGSALTLVETFLTTKLLEEKETDESECDSGLGTSSFSSASKHSSYSSDYSCKGSCGYCNVQSAIKNIKRARLFKFNPVTGLWTCQTTLVFLGPLLSLEDKVKGQCRDAFDVQFLHQDEVLGRYVGKRYKRQKPASQYLRDLTCQKIARFLVTLFNFALRDLRYDIQVVYVPVAHLQIISDKLEVEDWLNVEPYLEGDFIKLTNNLHFCNTQGKTLATSLTHFTYSVSKGRLMLVDLQGWLPKEGRGVVYLTDPQFHTCSALPLSACDMGEAGMQAFWTSVHPQCNEICKALDLQRP